MKVIKTILLLVSVGSTLPLLAVALLEGLVACLQLPVGGEEEAKLVALTQPCNDHAAELEGLHALQRRARRQVKPSRGSPAAGVSARR